MPSITGQSILIIGGSSGIGFAAAKLSLAEGARVAIASSNPARVANAIKSLQSVFPDGQIVGYECDLSRDDTESRLEKLFTDVTSDGTPLDHIIYTAVSSIVTKPIQEITIDYIRAPAQLNFIGPLLIAKTAPRFLKPGYTSSLIITGGQVAEKPFHSYTVFTSYASALTGMTRNLALDLAPLRVNLVSPGPTYTELWGPNREQRKEYMAKNELLGKVGEAEEVAEAYIYLMKDTNATGSCVSTNGGSLIK